MVTRASTRDEIFRHMMITGLVRRTGRDVYELTDKGVALRDQYLATEASPDVPSGIQPETSA